MLLKLIIGLAALALGAVSYVCTQHADSAPSTQVAAQGPTPNVASGEQRLEMTEQTLTERLNQRLIGRTLGDTPLGPATLTNLAAHLGSGQMVTTGEARVGSTSVPVSVTSHMIVQSGRPLVVIDDARAADIPLPDATRQSLQQAIQSQLDQEVGRMQVRVTSITIANGALVINGVPNH